MIWDVILPNGDIEYLGRIDAQVKIRGYRIELGEIESVLSQHRSVSEAVVLAREEESWRQTAGGLCCFQPGPSVHGE